MYLARTLKHNRRLVEAAIEFHQNGDIPPACFLIDADTVAANTRLVRSAAESRGIELFFMSKQIGHNPEVIDAIRGAGIDKTVAVDGRSAALLANAGIPLGNVGHLSQVPRRQLRGILSYRPQVVTVFNLSQAVVVAAAARDIGVVQDIQLKVATDRGPVFPGQDGGLTVAGVSDQLKEIADLDGVEVVGVTAYPCIDYNEEQKAYVPSVLVPELAAAAELVGDVLGVSPGVNAPGSTSVAAMPLLTNMGATVAEPGHALTGTGPHHANGDGPEEAAIVYVSEVVHVDDEVAYAIGGGLYRRGRLSKAIVGRSSVSIDDPPLEVSVPEPGYIDYHFSIHRAGRDIHVGDTVVCAFRPQVFVTYCRTASISGFASGTPHLGPMRDNLGNLDLGWTSQ